MIERTRIEWKKSPSSLRGKLIYCGMPLTDAGSSSRSHNNVAEPTYLFAQVQRTQARHCGPHLAWEDITGRQMKSFKPPTSVARVTCDSQFMAMQRFVAHLAAPEPNLPDVSFKSLMSTPLAFFPLVHHLCRRYYGGGWVRAEPPSSNANTPPTSTFTFSDAGVVKCLHPRLRGGRLRGRHARQRRDTARQQESTPFIA